jgi:hypothetical protein
MDELTIYNLAELKYLKLLEKEEFDDDVLVDDVIDVAATFRDVSNYIITHLEVVRDLNKELPDLERRVQEARWSGALDAGLSPGKVSLFVEKARKEYGEKAAERYAHLMMIVAMAGIMAKVAASDLPVKLAQAVSRDLNSLHADGE